MILKKGASGDDVARLQELLNKKGFPVEVNGSFGVGTYHAVTAFQSQNLDQHGQPLVVDGTVGPLTWWSLANPKPVIVAPSAVDYLKMPPDSLGGSTVGRAALASAISELKAGAGEVGGNNCGPFVKKYLAPAGLPEGNPWCASFVSWCFLQAANGNMAKMPFRYDPGARDLLKQFQNKSWAFEAISGYQPLPGDLVFWWRVHADGWQGHVGFVHQLKDGYLYTIEGNKSLRVQGFSYVFSRMEQLLGFGKVES